MLLLSLHEYSPGRRVYVKDLDVFGIIHVKEHPGTKQPIFIVVCESPMLDYKYDVTEYSELYDDAIGD